MTYLELREAISELPSSLWDEEVVDEVTVNAALEFLDFLEAAGAERPKYFSHGEDAIVFTTERDGHKRLITISGSYFKVLDTRKYTTPKPLDLTAE